MATSDQRVCPVERAGFLDGRLRRFFQNPDKIISPHVKEGMTVLDVGCGPGFFTLPMARRVGACGRVFACDMQQGMLDIIARKIEDSEMKNRITLHRCDTGRIGLSESFDFVLAFYMVHEVLDVQGFFDELHGCVRQGGKILMVEPKFHVDSGRFNKNILIAEHAGFMAVDYPGFMLSRAILLVRR